MRVNSRQDTDALRITHYGKTRKARRITIPTHHASRITHYGKTRKARRITHGDAGRKFIRLRLKACGSCQGPRTP
jgi:hypothetical protein